MIERYSLPQMTRIWSDEHRAEIWLKVEILALEAWEKVGLLSRDDLEKIKKNASFSLERMREIEKITHHDVIAFLTSISEKCGPESRFLHFGMTSSDMLDTTQGYVMKESADLLLEDCIQAMESIRKKALEHHSTLMVGRTHGVHAEPTTFGLKLAMWYTEMGRNRERLVHARDIIGVGKISGAVGNFANVSPKVEEYVCQKLGLRPAEVSTQIVQRDRYAEFVWAMTMVGTSLEKFALELRSLQRTEIREVEEGFSRGQKGSSAMPHKKNPITGEQICGLSRVLRGNLLVAMENIPLWHERDISHSSAERIILPDCCLLTDYLLHTFIRLIDHLVVYPDHMKKNLEQSRGLVFSERVLLELIKKGLTREEAYTLVQRSTLKTWESGTLYFLDVLLSDPELMQYFHREELEQLFDYAHYLQSVDTIFRRTGLTKE
ncbi:MAG: adenylosuccinate lyase [Atribacterota bacterium]